MIKISNKKYLTLIIYIIFYLIFICVNYSYSYDNNKNYNINIVEEYNKVDFIKKLNYVLNKLNNNNKNIIDIQYEMTINQANYGYIYYCLIICEENKNNKLNK